MARRDPPSEWYVSVFLGRILVPLVLEHFEGVDQTRAALTGFDHVVNETVARGHIGIGMGGSIFVNQFGSQQVYN